MIKKRKPVWVDPNADQFLFVPDEGGGDVGLTGDIIDVTGADGMTINGTNNLTGDIIMVAESQDVLVRTYAGDDIIFATNSSGSIYAGSGNDIVDASSFTGHVYLGADEGYDIVFLDQTNPATLHNFDETRDTIIWTGEAIA